MKSKTVRYYKLTNKPYWIYKCIGAWAWVYKDNKWILCKHYKYPEYIKERPDYYKELSEEEAILEML